MASHNLHKLAEKYWEGRTSEEEERFLREQLSQEGSPGGLASLAIYFKLLKAEQQPPSLDGEFDAAVIAGIRKRRKLSLGRWALRIAAAIAIIFALVFAVQRLSDTAPMAPEDEFADTFEDPEEAYREVKKALMLVSAQMNDGMEHTRILGKFHKTKSALESQNQTEYETN